MLPIIGWKIYRADGAVFSSSTHDISEVPDGIQVVIFYHEQPYRDIAYGEDSYIVEGRVFTGVWMDENKYYELVQTAFADEVLP